MTSLHNALRDHAHPDRHRLKKWSQPMSPYVPAVDDNTKSTAQILSDSKQIVTKLKGSLKSNIESLAKSTEEIPVSNPPEVKVPPAPKSPRMKLPASIPEPSKSDFAVPLSPRK